MFCCRQLGFQKWSNKDVFTFKLNFDVDILAIFSLANVLATFKKELALFFQSLGHPDLSHKLKHQRW
jgi:hypothetical protein